METRENAVKDTILEMLEEIKAKVEKGGLNAFKDSGTGICRDLRQITNNIESVEKITLHFMFKEGEHFEVTGINYLRAKSLLRMALSFGDLTEVTYFECETYEAYKGKTE